MPKPLTYDHLKSSKKPLELRIPSYLDDEPIERLEKLREDLERAKTREMALRPKKGDEEASPGHNEAGADLERLEYEVRAAEEAVRASTAWFVFRKPTPQGRKRYEKLVDAHPPTEEQIAEATAEGREKPPYNSETFAPALISFACAEPVLTIEEATELLEDWSFTECAELFSAALAVCTGRRSVNLGNG